MENISPEFNSTDALLLYSIAYCQRHNYKATLGQILLTTDAINRSFPTARQLEDGLSRLKVSRYIEIQNEIFNVTVTKMGVRLFDDITTPQNPKLNVFEQIRNLTNELQASHVKTVSKQLTITDAQVSEARQEAHALFSEISKEADEILSARKAKESP